MLIAWPDIRLRAACGQWAPGVPKAKFEKLSLVRGLTGRLTGRGFRVTRPETRPPVNRNLLDL